MPPLRLEQTAEEFVAEQGVPGVPAAIRWGRLLAPWLAPTILIAAAGLREVRLPALAGLAVGFLALRAARSGAAVAWAATLPVAMTLAWGLAGQPAGAADGSDCANPLSPPATWRVIEAGLAVVTFGLLAIVLRADTALVGFRRPSRMVGILAAVGFVVAGPFAVAIGPAVAAPFFGSVSLDTGRIGAIVPALAFALANGSMEELVYRGALRAWLTPSIGPGAAIVVQAIAFGLAHGSGDDYVGPAAPVVLAMTAGGLVAGVIAVRTRSLAFPMALHAAFDIPLYYYWACSLP
ncbi:MAG TPA: CPBP family intramembrane glutamic endopeptidase [Candidatus Limnocylindrales bacterium]